MTCACGRPIHDAANVCHDCADLFRANLHKIADRWSELEDALTWREAPGERGGKQKRGRVSTGAAMNEQASRARRAASDVVWFVVQVLREDFDNAGWTFDPPNVPRSQDSTPILARWIASWHVPYLTTRADPETCAEIISDTVKAESLTYKATHPSGVHKIDVNLACDQHATSDMGERIPCPGRMQALVGRDVMPDLECDHDPAHRIEPGVWERAGWKRRTAMHPNGVARLMGRLSG